MRAVANGSGTVALERLREQLMEIPRPGLLRLASPREDARDIPAARVGAEEVVSVRGGMSNTNEHTKGRRGSCRVGDMMNGLH